MNHVTVPVSGRTPFHRLQRPAIRTALAAWAVLLTACQDSPVSEPATLPPTLETMRQYVTGEAATNLSATGQFQLRSPGSDDPAEITGEQAIALAALWPRQFGPWLHDHLESQRGGRIELTALMPCGDAAYAVSPYSPMEGALATKPEVQAARRVYGPWWIISLCSRSGTPQLSVAVSAYSTDLRIENGEIRLPALGGEWFSVEGIPSVAGADFLEKPERLVQRLALHTGARVSEVPELIIPDRRDGFPNHARWRVTLERPVSGRTISGRHATQVEVYSWRRPGAQELGFLVSSASQPARVSFRYPTNLASTAPGDPLSYTEGFLMRRLDVPVSFEPVVLAGGN